MKSVLLTVYPRTLKRRIELKKVRGDGRVPAIVYGRQCQPQSLEMRAQDIEKLLLHSASENILVDLDIQDEGQTKRLALVQEVQHHPLSGKVLHVDFHEVSEDQKVTITVPVETLGEASGVKTGGVLEHVLFKLKVRALPKDLPEIIRVDVSSLEVGQSIHIGEIPAPAGVEILGDKRIPVITVAAALAEVQAAEVAPEAITEPEVIKEKKEETAETAPAKTAEKSERKR